VRHEILAKLKSHVARGLTREADVVYLLVQVRKLLEQENEEGEWPALHFYANWVVHHRLDRVRQGSAFQAMLGRLEAAVRAQSNQELAIGKSLADAVSLRTLYKDLIEFWETHEDLDVTLMKKAGFWENFAGLLISVLTDLPLVAPSAGLIREFRYLGSADVLHRVRFQVHLQSGKILEADLAV